MEASSGEIWAILRTSGIGLLQRTRIACIGFQVVKISKMAKWIEIEQQTDTTSVPSGRFPVPRGRGIKGKCRSVAFVKKIKEDFMFCVKCGTELNEGAEFCSKCGTKVGVTEKPVRKSKSFIPITILGIILLIIGIVFVPPGWYNGGVYYSHPHQAITLLIGFIFLAFGIAKFIKNR